MGFEDLVSKMNERNQFRKVCVDQGVIDSVVFYSKKSYPNEFLAMLDGHVKDNVLYITGLLFLPGERSHTSASFNDWMIPPNQKKWGVCEPYSLETMKAYNAYGEPVAFEVGNFPDENKDLMLEDLKQIKEEIDEMDGEELSPSFFDLDKDLSYFDDDKEKTNKYSHEFDESYNPYNISDEDLGSIDLNPTVVEIGGERINGQSPKLGLVIEFRDGKPILKGVSNKFLEEDDE